MHTCKEKKNLTQIWYNGYGFVRGRSVYGQRQVQAIIQVSKPLSGSHGGARQSSHTHTEAQFSAPAQGFTQDNSTSIHHERFYKVRSKNLWATANYEWTTSWPLDSSLEAQVLDSG